jgi:DNA-binding NarL/FixJ family response regulator
MRTESTHGKILIIEDQEDMRDNLATILEMENYSVVTAADGKAGIALARSESPDLVVCDVMMPVADGYEVLRELRRDRQTAAMPFIFMTAKGERTDQRLGMDLGADDYLTKPVTASDFLAAVASRLARERLRKPAEFRPDFTSPAPLETLGLTPREAEVLLWVAQGKSNPEIGAILGTAENTIKKHLQNLFDKLGVETRNAATLKALEVLGSSPATEERGA